jgi:hypothetical protein
MERLGYHSNLNPLSVLDDESPTRKIRREKGGFIRPLKPVQGESHQDLLDWHLRRRWDVYVHLEFRDRFPVGKVAVRDLFVSFKRLSIIWPAIHQQCQVLNTVVLAGFGSNACSGQS